MDIVAWTVEVDIIRPSEDIPSRESFDTGADLSQREVSIPAERR